MKFVSYKDNYKIHSWFNKSTWLWLKQLRLKFVKHLIKPGGMIGALCSKENRDLFYSFRREKFKG